MADSDNPLDDPAFAEALQSYNKALEGEWEASNPSVDDTPEELARKARKLVINDLPRIIARSVQIALREGVSEATALNACKFVYGMVIPQGANAPAVNDPIEQLMKELAKNDPPDATA